VGEVNVKKLMQWAGKYENTETVIQLSKRIKRKKNIPILTYTLLMQKQIKKCLNTEYSTHFHDNITYFEA
jgi:hypothetical protein